MWLEMYVLKCFAFILVLCFIFYSIFLAIPFNIKWNKYVKKMKEKKKDERTSFKEFDKGRFR